MLSQGGGRFIHDDDLRFSRQGFGDLHNLLPGNGQIAHSYLGTKVRVQLVQQILSRRVHGGPIDARGKTLGFLMAHEDVFRHRQIGVAGDMLIYRGHAVSLSIHRCVEMNRFAFQDNLAVIRLIYTGDDLDEGGFSGSVLSHETMNAAPFELELHVIQCFYAGKCLRNMLELQNRIRHFGQILHS
jgi:hypothetical protein